MLRLKWNGLRFAVYRATWCVDNEKRFAARFVVRVSLFKAVNREWCLHCRLNRTGFAICGSVKNIYNKSGNARTETSLLPHHILCYLQVLRLDSNPLYFRNTFRNTKIRLHKVKLAFKLKSTYEQLSLCKI